MTSETENTKISIGVFAGERKYQGFFLLMSGFVGYSVGADSRAQVIKALKAEAMREHANTPKSSATSGYIFCVVGKTNEHAYDQLTRRKIMPTDVGLVDLVGKVKFVSNGT